MADDIAVLGLAVDSKPVEAAAAKLDALATAAKGADQAAQGFERSAAKASAASTTLAANVNKAVNSATAINARLGVQDTFGGQARAADIAAYGAALDDTRAKLVPLFAIERQHAAAVAEINQAAKVGAINEAERAAAVTRAQVAFVAQTNAAKKSGEALELLGRRGGLAGHQISNLSFQLNDIATQAALGISPLRILASQGGQVFQILQQGPEGVSGSLKHLGSLFLGLLTPINLVIAGVAGFAAAGAAAAISWTNAQQRIQFAILGVGQASGVSVGQINAIAEAAAAAGKATVGEARDMATAFVATGRVSAEIAAQAVAVGRNVSKVFGEDIPDSTARLAKALADPAKGVDELDKRLAAFNDRTAQHIKNLAAQGRVLEANKILLDGTDAATRAAAAATIGWASAWEQARDAASKYWNVFQRGVAETFLGISEIPKRIAAIEGEMRRLIDQRRPTNQTRIRDLGDELMRLQNTLAKIENDNALAKLNRDSRELGDIIRANVGEEAAKERLLAEQVRLYELELSLAKQMKELGASDPLSKATRAELEIAKQSIALRIAGYKTAVERAEEEYQISLQTLYARTAEQKGDLAYRRTLAQLIPAGDRNAILKAQQAQSLAIAQHNKEISDEQRQQVLAADHKVQAARLELSLIGQTTAEQEKQKAILEVRQQLEAEAMRRYNDRNAIDQKQLELLTAQAVEAAKINEAKRQAQFFDDIAFERAQLTRSDPEGEAMQRLRAMGLLTNGNIETAAAQAAYEQIRLNQAIKTSTQLSTEFATGFVKDLRAGKTAAEALTNALNRLADRLLDMALNNTFQSLFGKVFASGFGKNGTGLDPNGMATPFFHSGGIVGQGNQHIRSVHPSVFLGAPRYHSGGLAGIAPNEVPAILQRGEMVLPRGMRAGSGAPAQVVIQIVNNHSSARVEAREEKDSNGNRRAVVVIDEMVASAMARPGSQSVAALRGVGQMVRR